MVRLWLPIFFTMEFYKEIMKGSVSYNSLIKFTYTCNTGHSYGLQCISQMKTFIVSIKCRISAPFQLKNEQKLPKFLVLHLGGNFMKIQAKKQIYRSMKICIKM